MKRPIIIAITGASGSPYAQRLIECLAQTNNEVHLTISDSGRIVIEQELGLRVDLNKFKLEQLLPHPRGIAGAEFKLQANFVYHHYKDFMAPIASGSFLSGGMVICPCSGTTLGSIVHALGGNLIQRAADVQLKEQRKLILVTRETPLSIPQLENMTKAAKAGAVMLPAMPGFYHGPESILDMIDFVVARILDQLGIEHQLMRRWGSED